VGWRVPSLFSLQAVSPAQDGANYQYRAAGFTPSQSNNAITVASSASAAAELYAPTVAASTSMLMTGGEEDGVTHQLEPAYVIEDDEFYGTFERFRGRVDGVKMENAVLRQQVSNPITAGV